MAKDKNSEKSCEEIMKKYWMKNHHYHKTSGGFYGLAVVGAAVYYVQQADTFGMGVLGILKAIIWPAMLIYKAFTLLAM